MSIATEITRLQGIKTDIQSALVTQGIEDANTHNMNKFAEDILAISSGEAHGATVLVTTEETTLAGTTAKLYKVVGSTETEVDAKSFSALSSEGVATVSFVIQEVGTYIVRCTDGTTSCDTKNFSITSDDVVNKNTITKEISLIVLVGFSSGTDEQITAMVQAYYDGKITLETIKSVWSVGSTRKIHINAISATNLPDSHGAGDYEFVILDFEHDNLTTPINGKTKALLTLQLNQIMIDPINRQYSHADDATWFGGINSTNSNVGGWDASDRRTWCNNVFINALPQWVQNTVKTVKKYTSSGNSSSTIITSNDKAFYISEVELTGTNSLSYSGEGTKYAFFSNTSKYAKLPPYNSNFTSASWMLRSPKTNDNNYFTRVHPTLAPEQATANYQWGGVVPAFCL